jgi:outer membrane autotransporter protein
VLDKYGSGALVLTAANTYSGGTNVHSGTIGIGNNSALGTGALALYGGTTLQFVASGLNIANNILVGAVDPTIDTGANTDTLSGVITGSANLTKIGSGALILTGASPSFTGATEVAAGALIVNGSIAASAVQVDSGATLGGAGTVGAIMALNGSILAPGLLAPYSTLNAAGAVTFNAGSTFLVNISTTGQNDKILAAGAAILNGAALQVQAANGSYTAANKYTLLTATGGVTGAFASTSIGGASFAFLKPLVTYDANDVYLGFTQKALFPSVGITPNQLATAGAIQVQGPGAIYNAVLGQGAAGARAAFDALSGEIHASAVSSAFQDSRLPREAVLDRLSDTFGAPPSSAAGFIDSSAPVVDPLSGNVLTLWGQAFGSSGHTAGDGNAASFNSTLGGFIFGADESIESHYRVGVAGGYTQSSLSAAARGSAGDVFSTFGGLYGGASFNALQLRAGALYAYNRFETNRAAVFPGFGENLASAYGGNTAQGFVEAGWRVPVNGFFARPSYVEPFAGGAVVAINSASFAETGGAAALNGQSSNYDYGLTTLGLRWEAGLTDSLPLVARGLLAWRHVFGDVTPNSVLAFAGTPSTLFSISGAPVYRDAAMIEAGLDWRLNAKVSLGVYYSGAISAQGSENAIKGRFEARF